MQAIINTKLILEDSYVWDGAVTFENGRIVQCGKRAEVDIPADAELIDAQVEQLMNLAEKFEVEYDGWGTYFEDPNGEDGEEGDDEDYIDEDDDGVRH